MAQQQKSIQLPILPRPHAASLALHAQGLAGKNFGKGKAGALATIQHLGYIQLDTLAVVARAHHHTLWTRAQAYTEKQLDALMQERSVFEYWSHAASYLPMNDYRFSLVRKKQYRSGKKSHWFGQNKKMMRYVLDRIAAEGALQARDFENDRRRGSWFDWKPAKIALENLFMDGTLMVASRKGFQKVYDLTERVLPVEIDTSFPNAMEQAEYLVRTGLRALGVATQRELTYMKYHDEKAVAQFLKEAVSNNELTAVHLEGSKELHYVATKRLHQKQKPIAQHVHILSPFDNVLIQRHRTKKIFNYDYQVECYVPEPKRRFGYFCLPILFGDAFVGRCDAKADRAAGVFIVKKFSLEHPPQAMDVFLDAFANALIEFAAFHGCEQLVVEATQPAKFKSELRKRLK